VTATATATKAAKREISEARNWQSHTRFGVVRNDALGDFEPQTRRRKLRLLKGALYISEQVGVFKLPKRR
jgi:hypothetical protein